MDASWIRDMTVVVENVCTIQGEDYPVHVLCNLTWN
jgi:hypothetical protein